MKTKVQELRDKIRAVSGENVVFGSSPDCPREREEAFLESVLMYETSPKRILVDLLKDLGIELPRPKKLSDGQLTAKLWEVIHALLRQSIVIGNTDHLTDRELYTLLWNETLRQEYVISRDYTLHIDMTKTGPDEGMPIYLKYYATEEQRRLYSEFYPTFKMPEYVEPPPRRDHLIPDVPPPARRKRVN